MALWEDVIMEIEGNLIKIETEMYYNQWHPNDGALPRVEIIEDVMIIHPSGRITQYILYSCKQVLDYLKSCEE